MHLHKDGRRYECQRYAPFIGWCIIGRYRLQRVRQGIKKRPDIVNCSELDVLLQLGFQHQGLRACLVCLNRQ